MKCLHALPELPPVGIEVVEDQTESPQGFLWTVHRSMRLIAEDGTVSRAFDYYEADRQSLDAAVVAAHFVRTDGDELEPERWVVLRSTIRPPVALRAPHRGPVPRSERALWEVPAGLIEPSEGCLEGIRRAAARELFEETGLSVPEEALRELGPPIYPCPGVIAEAQYLFSVEVTFGKARRPPSDGSVLEEAGQVVAVPLRVALEAVRQGMVADAKSELVLRRLAERVGLQPGSGS